MNLKKAGLVICCGFIFALTACMGGSVRPVVNVNVSLHPNLAEAQMAILGAWNKIEDAQNSMGDIFGLHAQNAKNLLVKASDEVKLAAETANGKTVSSDTVTYTDEAPTVTISSSKHPNLAEAQQGILTAYNKMVDAQKANNYDMGGHAQNVKGLLSEASAELKKAAKKSNR